MSRFKVLIVFGTRPEAIKMFPVVRALQCAEDVDVRVCITAQHRGLLDQVLEIAGIVPDIDLNIMEPDQTLDSLTARLLLALGATMDKERPDRILVQGDTTTAMVAALAAYYRKIPVGHVEAGLRSGNLLSPWPEEANRRIIMPLADLHFAPTRSATEALYRESAPGMIYQTGNTVIDALHWTLSKIEREPNLTAALDPILARFAGRRVVLVTTHRRENFGDGMRSIATALKRLAQRDDIAILFPMHPNPRVKAAMDEILPAGENVARIPPLDYPQFIHALNTCHIVLSDSGGVQEEAPAVGRPVLVMRDTTERPEGIEAGTALLVGTDRDNIVSEVERLLDEPEHHARMAAAHNPFGDGHAASRIAEAVMGAKKMP